MVTRVPAAAGSSRTTKFSPATDASRMNGAPGATRGSILAAETNRSPRKTPPDTRIVTFLSSSRS